MVKNLKNGKKYCAAVFCALVMCVMLAGCMNTSGSVTPNTQNSTIPQNTMQPSDWNSGNVMENNGDSGITGGTGMTNTAPIFDWLNMGTGVEDRINMISEIEKCRIVVNEGTALVGVTFAGQYQGELTQRIRDMVAGEIMQADANIQTVAVTAEAEDVQKINQMADQIASGTPAQDFKSEIDSIARNVTTLQ